jgi:NADH:ubiquinone oxidoreductase subunit 5 (subunit L)/multisubunit Na+/H+ antiporter MnhA subunit
MLIFMLSLGGIPPTAGFMGKFWLFGAAIEGGYYWLAVIGVLNSAVSLYYYIRVVVFMYIKKETSGSEPILGPALGLTLGAAVVLTLLLGVYPRALFDAAESSAATLAGRGQAGDRRRNPIAIARALAGELFHNPLYSSVGRRSAEVQGWPATTDGFRAGCATRAAVWNSPPRSPGSLWSASGSTGITIRILGGSSWG